MNIGDDVPANCPLAIGKVMYVQYTPREPPLEILGPEASKIVPPNVGTEVTITWNSIYRLTLANAIVNIEQDASGSVTVTIKN